MNKKMTMKEFNRFIDKFRDCIVSEDISDDWSSREKYRVNESLKDDVTHILCLVYDMYDELKGIDKYSNEDLGLVDWYLGYFNIETEVN